MGNGLAYRTATAALCVQSIDGQDLPTPIGMDDDAVYARDRFNYAKLKWFQFTVDAIFNEYLVLEARTRLVVEAMGKVYGSKASTPG
jgi:hypothetical protein